MKVLAADKRATSPTATAPWSTLKYDTNLEGYVTGVTADSLKGAPSYSRSSDWEWSRENDRRVYQYYKAEPFWG